MNSELEACFDKWEASFDALCRYLLDTASGVVGPVPASSSTAKHVTAAVVATDVSYSTTQAQEAPAVAHDAPPGCIEMVPVTCSMACPTQVCIEMVPVTNTNVDPKAGVQELDGLSVNTTDNDDEQHGASLAMASSQPIQAHVLDALSSSPSFNRVLGIEISPITGVPLAMEENQCTSSTQRPIPWPSFAGLPGGVQLAEPWPSLQGTSGEFFIVDVMYCFFQQIFDPDGPSIVKDCSGLSYSNGSPTSELPNDYCASVTNLCLPATTSVHDLGSGESVEHQLSVIHEHVNRLAGSFTREKWWSTRNWVYTIQEWTFCEHLEHAPVCNILRHEKSQGTIQIMSMSVHWPFLNQTELKSSGHFDMKCNAEQIVGGSRAKVQFTALITFECCSPLGATTFGDNTRHMLVVQIITTFLGALHVPEKYVLDDAAGTVHHLIWKIIRAEWHQPVTQPKNNLPLLQPKPPWPLHIIMVTKLSLTGKQTITEDIYVRTACWTLIQFAVTALPNSKSSMLFPLHLLRNWGLASSFLLDIISRVLRCPSHAVSKLNGMVDKAEPISKMDIPIHWSEQQLTLPVPDEDVYRHDDTQTAIYVHMSWDPGGVTMSAFNLQSSMITSQEAQAMNGMSFSQCSDQEHFVTAGLAQGYVDHKYYISFYNDYLLDIGRIGLTSATDTATPSFKSNHDFELVKEYRVHWDPGGSRRRRLGVKPNFKEGGC